MMNLHDQLSTNTLDEIPEEPSVEVDVPDYEWVYGELRTLTEDIVQPLGTTSKTRRVGPGIKVSWNNYAIEVSNTEYLDEYSNIMYVFSAGREEAQIAIIPSQSLLAGAESGYNILRRSIDPISLLEFIPSLEAIKLITQLTDKAIKTRHDESVSESAILGIKDTIKAYIEGLFTGK